METPKKGRQVSAGEQNMLADRFDESIDRWRVLDTVVGLGALAVVTTYDFFKEQFTRIVKK